MAMQEERIETEAETQSRPHLEKYILSLRHEQAAPADGPSYCTFPTLPTAPAIGS